LYAGAKQRLASTIVSLLPEHRHYVEPFAGSLSVLLAKPASMMETVNDLDQDLMTFWRVLRDHPKQLRYVCANTPHSRAEFAASMPPLPTDLPDMELARRVWVRLTQGRGARMNGRSGWRFTHGGNRMAMAAYKQGYVSRLAPVAQRLQRVSLECRPALDVITAYDKPHAVFYIDPPYLPATRGTQDCYQHEMTTDDHHDLLHTLATVSSPVILSGYPSDLYATELRDWRPVSTAHRDMNGRVRDEVLWLNFDPPSIR